MKLKMTLVAVLAAAALPMVASAHAGPRLPMTDSQVSQSAHREQRQIRPDFSRKVLAYGYINVDGTTASGSGNFTSSWDLSNSWYQIGIKGTNYYYSSFSTVVTPSNTAVCRTDSVNGYLLVQCHDLIGDLTQANFSFITF